MKIKIAYIVSTLRQSGPTNQLYGILKYLDRNEFDPSIITLSPEPENSMINLFRDLNVPIISMRLSRIKGQIFGKNKLRKTLQKIQPDLIHTQGVRPDVMVHGLKTSIPHILSLRNYPFDDYPAKFGNFAGQIMAKSHFKVISQAKYATLCSKSLSKIYKEYQQLNLNYIQNGVNVEKYHPISIDDKLKLKEKLGLPVDKKIILSVGSLIPRKQNEVAVEAFLKSKINAKSLFLIAGDGPEKQKLEAIASGDPSIRFLGEIDNVKEYLQVADIFISVSYSEGLPNTVLEAMACSLPVVLTDILPHIELVGEQYPYLSKVKDVEQTTKNLDSILGSDLDKIGVELLETVKRNFTAEIMSKKYQELYLNVING